MRRRSRGDFHHPGERSASLRKAGRPSLQKVRAPLRVPSTPGDTGPAPGLTDGFIARFGHEPVQEPFGHPVLARQVSELRHKPLELLMPFARAHGVPASVKPQYFTARLRHGVHQLLKIVSGVLQGLPVGLLDAGWGRGRQPNSTSILTWHFMTGTLTWFAKPCFTACFGLRYQSVRLLDWTRFQVWPAGFPM